MISAHAAVRPRGLHRSSTKGVISTSSATTLLSPSSTAYQPSDHRDFSWGSKYTHGNKNAGKVWKGYSTHDHTRAQKQLYRGSFYNTHYTPHLYRYLPDLKWRCSSSWGKPGSAWIKVSERTEAKTTPEEKAVEDWYSRCQLQKKAHYEEFMKRMEEDPIGMLFGKRWANWIDSTEAKMMHASGSKTQTGDPETKAEKPSWDRGYAESGGKSIRSKGNEHTREQTTPGKNIAKDSNQEYEIDPITNRRVQKTVLKSKDSLGPELPPTKATAKGSLTESSGKMPAHGAQNSFNIPLKPFVPPITNTTPDKSPKITEEFAASKSESSSNGKPQEVKAWLAQEGFGSKQDSIIGAQPIDKSVEPKAKYTTAKIESALDRHLLSKTPSTRDPDRTPLQYNPQENTTDDVDLLRSSDVRASAGLRRRPTKESEADRQKRQRQLEQSYDNTSTEREKQLAEEVARNPPFKPNPTMEPTQESRVLPTGEQHGQHHSQTRSISPEWANTISEPPPLAMPIAVVGSTLVAKSSIKANRIRTQIVPLKARLDAMKADYDALRQQWLDEKRRQEEKAAKRMKDMHEEEVRAQKVAMESIETRPIQGSCKGRAAVNDNPANKPSDRPTRRLQSYLPGEGDMASNVHEFASRDRWYKKKAPHANDEMDAKLQRVAQDRALIREVRGIYEETYGTIDTNHRQSSVDVDFQRPVAQSDSSQQGKSAHLPTSDSSHATSIETPSAISKSISKGEDPLATLSTDSTSTDTDSSLVRHRLSVELREAQALLQNHRKYLRQVLSPDMSQVLHIDQCSEALGLISQLTSKLSKAQRDIRDQRRNIEQIATSEKSDAMLRAAEEYKQSLNSMNENVAKLGQYSPGFMEGSGPSSNIAVHRTDDTPTHMYRVLAFDTAQRNVIASKAKSSVPFSKEKPILPVEALEGLENPGSFLPQLTALHNQGYIVVSGTSNTLVLKKSASPKEIEDGEHTEVTSAKRRGLEESDLINEESKIEGIQESQVNANPSSLNPSAPPEPVSIKSDSGGPASSDTTASASGPTSYESNLPPIEKVRREEAVFSGPSCGNWHETESRRSSKGRRRAYRRFRTLRHVLVTGTVTASFCYGVGVISQMMQH